MPFIDPDTGTVTNPDAAYVGLSQYDKPSPAFLETLSATLRQDNVIGSAIVARANRFTPDYYEVEEGYDVFDHVSGYEEYAKAGYFDDVYNSRANTAVKMDIDRERRDRATQAASGWTATIVSQMIGQGIDPTILLPAGAFVKAGRFGYSVGKSALAVGAGAAAGALVQEAGLQATQRIRPLSESAINIGGTAILGGLIGVAGASILGNTEFMRFSRKLEEELTEAGVPNAADVTEHAVGVLQQRQAGLSADVAMPEVTMADLGVADEGLFGKVAESIARATAYMKINPGLQTMFSPSLKVREIYSKMIENPIYMKMNMEGETTGAGAETLMKEVERGMFSKWARNTRAIHKEYNKQVGGGLSRAKIRRGPFYDLVSRAMRRGDDGAKVTDDPVLADYVTRAARETRETVFEPLLKRAVDEGALSDDLIGAASRTAESYLTRMWSRQTLTAREADWRFMVRQWAAEMVAKAEHKGTIEFGSDAERIAELDDIVSSIYDNLMGRGTGDVPTWAVPVTKGPLKERTFSIPDAYYAVTPEGRKISVEDFLENDLEMITRRYTRNLAAELELKNKFGRADMADQIKDIENSYKELSAAAKTEKERNYLAKARERDLTNIQAFRDLLRGTYRSAQEGSDWSKLTRFALAWNYMRLLGGVTLTSVADAMRMIQVHGIRATMSEALPALVSGLKAAKISRADARDLGAVTEVVMQTRLATLAELNDPYLHGSKVDRFISNATNIFSKATGLSYWNDIQKTMNAVMTQNRMAKNALNWGNLGKREKAYMAYLGIDEDMAARIAKEIDTHGVKERNIWGANVSKWDDVGARRAWAAALNKDVDRTIVTKGVADQPLWTRTNAGRIFMQFKSFGLASHQRVLIAGLQERPHRFIEQAVFGTALGMMISYLKMIERGDTERADRLLANPGLWVADGFDRTGIASLFMDVSNTGDKMSAAYGGPNIGLSALTGAIAGDEDRGGGLTRYASRNAAGAVGGPTAGVVEDWPNIMVGLARLTGLAEGDVTQSQINAGFRQIPGATLPGMRSFLHIGAKPAIEDALR